ncbi:MAG: phosphomethylpyrimidine synthase ThiC, partial [Pseudoramibacter sp.]
DVAPGYDNITGAIGGAFAGMYGADFLCNLTPAEHLGLPTEEDVVMGVRTARLAADCVNMLRRDSRSYQHSKAMAEARVKDDPQAQIDNALFPEMVKDRMGTEPAHDHCAACSEGLCPADYAYQYFFGD